MIAAISWVPKGVSRSIPTVVEPPSKEEIKEILNSRTFERRCLADWHGELGMTITAEDAIIVCARNEDDVSHLEASNAHLQFLFQPATEMLFEFVNEMPKLETQIKIDLASVLGPLFFTWVILQLLPVILTSLVYEKQQKLRIMMKMHGLGADPYWMITYAYFLVIYLAYMLCFVLFGSVIGNKTRNGLLYFF